jgi:hypothetical protein
MKNHFMKSIIREDAVINLDETGAGVGGEPHHRKLKRLHYTQGPVASSGDGGSPE